MTLKIASVFLSANDHGCCTPCTTRLWEDTVASANYIFCCRHDSTFLVWQGGFGNIVLAVNSVNFRRNKSYNANTRGVPQQLPIPTCRFSVVSLDLISEFPLSKKGDNAIVVFTDGLSKRVWLEAINKASSARALAEIFLRTVF